MKKIITITALLAAGTGLANANVQSPYLTVPVGGNFWAGSYSFSFTLTDDDLSSITDGLVLAIYWGKVGTGAGYAVSDNANAFYFKKESSNIKLAVGEGTLATTSVPTADFKTGGTLPNFTVNTDTQRYITTTDALTAGTYSISVVGANGSQTVSLKKGATDFSFTGGKGNNAYNGNMNGQLSGNMNTAVNLSYIPEPSAFGLLAGAGALVLVAARRRRRAK